MKYLSFVILFFFTFTTNAELQPMDSLQLSHISGQASIPTSLKNDRQIDSNSNLLQVFSLLSNQSLNNSIEQKTQLSQPYAEEWAQTSTMLTLSAIPFFGSLFMLASQNNDQ